MTGDPAAVRVALVDDDPLVRTGLRLLLTGDRTIAVVAEAADGVEAVSLASTMPLDVMLMDIRMPRLDGVEATRQVAAGPGSPQVVMLTTFDADATVLAAVRAGASGFLLKHATPDEIVAAVHGAAAGEPVFSPKVLRALVGHARSTADSSRTGDGEAVARTSATAWRQLSDRERQIAVEVARGRSNAEIADLLYVSAGTVKADISTMLARLGLTNRIQLAVLAHEQVS